MENRRDNRKAKITDDHILEAAALKAIYERRRPELGLSQEAFGQEWDIGSQGLVWQYLNGRTPLNLHAAMKFAEGLGVNISEFSERLSKEASHVALAAGDQPSHQSSRKLRATHGTQGPRPQHVRLPVLDVSPSAGSGGEPIDYPIVLDYMEIPEAWAHHKLGRDLSRYRLLPVSGDSMSPTINDGDLAFVDTSVQSFGSEGIYVIVWHDRLLIKRLRAVLATQRVEIRSDNTDGYGVETVSMDELSRLHICGLVRNWWSIRGA